MTTPAPAVAPKMITHTDAHVKALLAIARHVTGHSDDKAALAALGLGEAQIKAITGG